jgi:hypothetical protein
MDPQRCLKMYELWTSLGWVTAKGGPGGAAGGGAADAGQPEEAGPSNPAPAPSQPEGKVTPSWAFARPLASQLQALAAGAATRGGGKSQAAVGTPGFGLDLSAFPGAMGPRSGGGDAAGGLASPPNAGRPASPILALAAAFMRSKEQKEK